MLVTSRPYGLDSRQQQNLKLLHAPILGLDRTLQALAVRRWFVLLKEQREQGLKTTNEMIENLHVERGLDDLGINPLLLTAMCIIYDEGKRLPHDKYGLTDTVRAREDLLSQSPACWSPPGCGRVVLGGRGVLPVGRRHLADGVAVGSSRARAARGEYPWGDEYEPGICNNRDVDLNGTSAVGIFPRSRSPFGLEDMAGNVWEWCQDAWRAPSQVDRGGGWRYDAWDCRSVYRSGYEPEYRLDYLGFRVATVPPRAPNRAQTNRKTEPAGTSQSSCGTSKARVAGDIL